jgi:hypothetical protein
MGSSQSSAQAKPTGSSRYLLIGAEPMGSEGRAKDRRCLLIFMPRIHPVVSLPAEPKGSERPRFVANRPSQSRAARERNHEEVRMFLKVGMISAVARVLTDREERRA